MQGDYWARRRAKTRVWLAAVGVIGRQRMSVFPGGLGIGPEEEGGGEGERGQRVRLWIGLGEET